MNLERLFEGIPYEVIQGETHQKINKITYDSREVTKGDLFFCIEGFQTDGHRYIKKAYDNGATVIVCEKELENLPPCTVVKVKDSRKALALAGANFYNHPVKEIKLIGITGTNGKTTSTFMLKSILEKAGYKVGIIGTIANYIGDKKIPSHRTTPESLELHGLFAEMKKEGIEYCVMEVSSHSLSLDRVYGLTFSQGVFTNLTQDHLDFHKTFENYYNAKMTLFKNSKCSIINIDDFYGEKLFGDIKTEKSTYSIDKESTLKAKNIKMHSRGIGFEIESKGECIDIELLIPGRYNVYNALGCAAACLNEGIGLDVIKKGLEDVVVPGRCEIVTKGYELGFEIIVDYAHTPDGLENILSTVREFTKGKLISVFGCGGDRDKTKRPIMGKIGSEYSDIAIITSDNPRSEEPISIIQDIMQGIKKENYKIIENRRKAIKTAMEVAGKGDVIVIAGKGHEDYQELKQGVIHFDEREIIAELIKELF